MSMKMSRRKFFAVAGASGVAAAAAVATKTQETDKTAQAGKSRQGQGYHVTDHVRRYYETTKV
jgi:hypothetical protein